MKQILISLSLLFSLCCTAQIETRSSLDANSDGSITKADVDSASGSVLGKLTDDPRVVNTGNSHAALSLLNDNLAAIQDKLKRLEKMGAYNYGNYINGHEYVDLGLSVKWAACNVGAFNPEDNGLYFSWGETTGYTTDKSDGHDFGWTAYSLCDDSNTTMNKYCTSSDYGTVDNDSILDLDDDAANKNWGGSWRMPTREEWTELIDNSKCTWEATTQDGISGYKVTSKSTGNSIFLPIAGFRNNTGIWHTNAAYWTSSLVTATPYYAYWVTFKSNDNTSILMSHYGSRFSGHTVRAVCE